MTKTTNAATLLALAATVLAGSSALAVANPEGSTLSTPPVQFTQKQAREHLAHQGYRNITPLSRDENGAWRGAAMKNGEMRLVAVGINAAR